MAAGERWSAFFDTTELRANRIPSSRLKESVVKTSAGLYVCELVIEERAFQRLTGFHEDYDTLRSAKGKVENYVTVDVGEPSRDNELLERFRTEERDKLNKGGFTIIPSESVSVADVAALRKYRDPRIKNKKGRGVPEGLNDAIILLSSMKYAQANGLNRCLFVSANSKDFSDGFVQGLGRDYGQEWRFITDVEAAIFFLEEPDVAKAGTEFIRSNSHALLSFIEKEKAKWPNSFLLLGPASLGDIEVFTIERLAGGAEMELTFRATVRFAPWALEPSYRRAAVLYTIWTSAVCVWRSQISRREGQGAVRETSVSR